MVGAPEFGLLQWKKLMTDSLDHSVWNGKDNGKDDQVRKMVRAEWEAQYTKFVYKILKDYSGPKKAPQSSS